MGKRLNKKRTLVLAVLATLLAGNTAWADQNTTNIVADSSDIPYSSIRVDGRSNYDVIGRFRPVNKLFAVTHLNVIDDVTISMSSSGGIITVDGNTGLNNSHGQAYAYGVFAAYDRYNVFPTMTIKKPVNITISATGIYGNDPSLNGNSIGSANAYGISNGNNSLAPSGTIIMDDVTMDVSVVGDTVYKKWKKTNVLGTGIDNSALAVTVGKLIATNISATGGIAFNNDPSNSADATASAYGVHTYYDQSKQAINKISTLTTTVGRDGETNTINIKAQGGNATDYDNYDNGTAAVIAAVGIGNDVYGTDQAPNLNKGTIFTTTVKGSTVISVNAVGGTSGYLAGADGLIAGVANGSDNQNNRQDNLILGSADADTHAIKVHATGGTCTKAAGCVNASATGISNYSATGTFKINGATILDVEAIAGKSIYNYIYNASACALGLDNHGATAVTTGAISGHVTTTALEETYGGDDSANSIAKGIYNANVASLTTGSVNLKVTANGGRQSSDAQIAAVGIDNSQGTVNVNGTTNLLAVTNPLAKTKNFYAQALRATRGTINIGTDGTNSLSKQVTLTGDVYAGEERYGGGGGTINLVLDQSGSYLQGNVVTNNSGVVNLSVSNGATWKPVYANTNGSFIVVGTEETYNPAYVSASNSIGNLNLNNGGSIDLGWDNATRSDTFRTLTINKLSGADGVVKLHSDLANNKADNVVLGDSSDATSLKVAIAYDPATSDVTGKALVVMDGANKTLKSVTGKEDGYNTISYTPTIVDNGNGTYSLTKLTITNVIPTGKTAIYAPSRPMREARHQRMAMHNLWVNGELNNMEKRMGDLRAAEPAEAGIWARYEYNKLEKGDNASLKYNYFQLGYDKDFKGDTGNFYRGAAFSYAKGTGDYELGTGDLKEGALSLYQTWIGKDGRYYDIIAKAGKLLNNYNATATANSYTSDYHTWGYSIGGEVGKRFIKANGFFVEPQFEFTLGRINGADYTTSTGMNVNVDAQNSAIARLGVAVGKEIKNGGSYYAKASYFHDFGGGLNLTASDSTTNPFSYGEDSAKNWCIFTLGGAVKAGKNCNVFGELSKYTGELSNNVQVNVGARWNF